MVRVRFRAGFKMIGAAKLLSAGVPANSPYSVILDPGEVIVNTSNGSSNSPIVYSTVISGVGPYLYSWVITGSSITIESDSSENTRFRSSGFNSITTGVATLTVTDEGNANAETSKEISIKFLFGL